MGLFNNFPYMDLSNLNLDFVLKKLKDLTNYTQSAEQAAESAEQSASSAQQSAESAEQSASSAQQSAESAEGSADSAQNYAEHIADPVGGLVTGWLDDNITPTTPPVDASLTIQGAAADAKATGDAIAELRGLISVASIKESVKQSLLQIARKVSYIDANGQSYYDALYSALYDAELLSITASYVQIGVVLDIDSIESLRSELTVTAHYDDGTSTEVTTYTLTGTLTAGTSTITVVYGNKSTTFTVNVTGTTDVTPLLTAWTAATYTAVTVDAEENTVTARTTQQKTYQGITAPFTTDSGYSYRFEADASITTGLARVAALNSSSSIVKASTTITDSGHLKLDFNHDATIASLRFYITFATAISGNVTFSNIKVSKYIEA